MKPNKLIKSAFLAGLIGIAGCALPKEEFSLSQIAERMDNIRADYSNSLAQVDAKMDQVMTSRYFSENDQKIVYNTLKTRLMALWSIKNFHQNVLKNHIVLNSQLIDLNGILC